MANLSKKDIMEMLSIPSWEEASPMFEEAYKVKLKYTGGKVHLRGIIEFSNICTKNCYYCGIRRDNKNVERFSMSKDEILSCAEYIYEKGYGSIVLQSGERKDKEYIKFVEEIVKDIKKLSNDKLGITLSCGEQSKETYKRWFEAGAHRYLLRIETSSPELYKKLHPPDHSFYKRLKCLEYLRDVGYQVGTGIMIGLPYQTVEDLANDIIFYKEFDIDMIGMGPYVVHENTPLAEVAGEIDNEKQLFLALKVFAVTRIYLEDVNIASTTALEALMPGGREWGLKCGANIIMPVVTPQKYRGNYSLYQNKPGVDENAEETLKEIVVTVEKIGEKVMFNQWGDSPHYFRRIENNKKK